MGDMKTAKLLIDSGADVNADIEKWGRLLHLAAARGIKEMVELLLENGADTSYTGGQWGGSVLHVAAHSSAGPNLELARLLIHHGANVNAINLKLITPLSIAVFFGYVEYARLLFERGAYVEDWKSLLHSTTLGDREDMLRLL